MPRIEYMTDFVLPARAERIREVASNRTRYLTVCTENTFHPQNASALVRTCEAFGVQDMHTIETLCGFQANTNIVRGTDKWIDLYRHHSTAEAVDLLHCRGYRIIATSPHEGDTTMADFDETKGPFCLVFGTEKQGISPEMERAADGFLMIPMCGFVESLNVSASAAILLSELSARVRRNCPDWHLTETEQAELILDWTMQSVADSENILLHRFQE